MTTENIPCWGNPPSLAAEAAAFDSMGLRTIHFRLTVGAMCGSSGPATADRAQQPLDSQP